MSRPYYNLINREFVSACNNESVFSYDHNSEDINKLINYIEKLGNDEYETRWSMSEASGEEQLYINVNRVVDGKMREVNIFIEEEIDKDSYYHGDYDKLPATSFKIWCYYRDRGQHCVDFTWEEFLELKGDTK